MKTERRILKNALSLTLGKIFGDLATFIFLIYFARKFGISTFGQYAFAMSIGGFLSILVSLGLNRLAIREISKDVRNDAKYIGNLLIIQCVMALISWSLIALFTLLSSFNDETKFIILIIGSYQILYKLSQLYYSRFKAHEDMEYSAFLEIFHKVLILILGSLCIMLWEDPVITLLVYPFSAFSMLLIGIMLSFRKYGPPDISIDFLFIRKLLTQAAPFLVLLALAQFYDRIGLIFLTALQGDAATGIYASSDRFLVTIISAVGMFGSALFPIISRFADKNHNKLIMVYERAIRIIMLCVFPVATFMYLFNEEIILLIYGEAFAESASVLAVLSWVIIPAGLNVILTGILVATDQLKEFAKIQLFVFSVYFIACVAIIPQFSYVGLAYAKLGTSVILCTVYLRHLSKTNYRSSFAKSMKSPLFACITTVVVFRFISDVHLGQSILIAILTYSMSLLLTGGINHHDLSYVKKILLTKK